MGRTLIDWREDTPEEVIKKAKKVLVGEVWFSKISMLNSLLPDEERKVTVRCVSETPGGIYVTYQWERYPLTTETSSMWGFLKRFNLWP